MFETEAGFAETKMLINCNGDYSKKQNYKKGWQDGAEFGYNKAKEEMQEQGLALQSDMDKTIEQNIQLKKQIEKMKCCQNCKKLEKEKDGLLFCIVGSFYTNAFGKNCDKWEIKEND